MKTLNDDLLTRNNRGEVVVQCFCINCGFVERFFMNEKIYNSFHCDVICPKCGRCYRDMVRFYYSYKSGDIPMYNEEDVC